MKRIKKWCASYRQHTLPHRGGRLRVGWLREASHQNPRRGQIGCYWYPGGLPDGESTLRSRCLSVGCLNNVKRIKNWCASYRQHTPYR
nr:hypothetical protein [Methylomarinum sp. Ch1-1]MDP4521153.1 hypothetical protein [Methylomarinum sp. Ch1-1]